MPVGHTPAPWRVEEIGIHTSRVRMSDGMAVGSGDDLEPGGISHADAHLIAAAPDLLAAAKAAYIALPMSKANEDTNAALAAAIAKAEGR